MANVYVYSGAAGAGTGADWANAYTTLGAATAAKAAGDTFWVAHNHAETAAAAKTITFPGTAASPNYCYCVTSAGSVPPVAADLRTTATITTTGANAITLNGIAYVYGITFTAGDGASNANVNLNGSTNAPIAFQSCNFVLGGSSGAASIRLGPATADPAKILWNNCVATFAATSQGFLGGGSIFQWTNTASALGGATIPTSLFETFTSNTTQVLVLDGVDLSAAGSGKTLIADSFGRLASASLLNCKLGNSVTVAATPTSSAGGPIDLMICDSGDTGYRQERYTYAGTLTTETTYTRVGGATDPASNLISWKVVTTANAKNIQAFRCFTIPRWNATTGSSVTATIEIQNSGTTLTNADVWVEIEYLGTSGFPLASLASSAPATLLTTASNLASSSATWNGSLASAVKQYLTVSFTPQEAGYVRATVCVGKASQTLYIDPVVTLS